MAGTKKVAVIGFGNIGTGVVDILYQKGVAGPLIQRQPAFIAPAAWRDDTPVREVAHTNSYLWYTK